MPLPWMAYHMRAMQRDPFVRYRSGRRIGEATSRVVVCNMLQAHLVLRTSTWRGRRVLLDERFASHDEGKAERRDRPTLTAIMEVANQRAVISASGL
jgi:hypothetical protein